MTISPGRTRPILLSGQGCQEETVSLEAKAWPRSLPLTRRVPTEESGTWDKKRNPCTNSLGGRGKKAAMQLSPSSLSGNTRAGFLPRYHKIILSWPHYPSSFPKSCHVQNKTSAQAGQRRMRYFLLGSAFSFSLKKPRLGKKPASVSCCTSMLPPQGWLNFPELLLVALAFSLTGVPVPEIWKY